MRLLCTADIHIHDYSVFSIYDEDGISSRALLYLDLADDILKHAQTNRCDGIVLAGDIMNSARTKPHLSDILGKFLRTLSSDTSIPLYIIDGNHDLDNQLSQNRTKHSVLNEITQDLDNIIYPRDKEYEKVSINGDVIILKNWDKDYSIVKEEADVFVGHGPTIGCNTFVGYMFSGGFKQDDLFKYYKLSVLGDIHNPQVFTDKESGRKVLIPSVPIQATWNDSPNCGLWVADTKDLSFNFTSIHEIRKDHYHRFLHDSTGKKESTELIHYKVRRVANSVANKSKASVKDSKDCKDRKVDISEIIGSIIDEDTSLDNKSFLKDILNKEILPNISTTSRTVDNFCVNGVSISNFMSVDKVDIDFNSFDRSCVILGNNGTGKTSLLEALYWCITGSTTKGILSDEVVRHGTTQANVSIKLSNPSGHIEIKRGRGDDNFIDIIDYRADKDGVSLDSNSIKKNQDLIYELLGVNQKDLSLFLYFSAQSPLLFGDLTPSDKSSVLSLISDIDIVEAIRVFSSGKHTEYTAKYMELTGELNACVRSIDSYQENLAKLNSGGDTDKQDELRKILAQYNGALAEEKRSLDIKTDDDIRNWFKQLTGRITSNQAIREQLEIRVSDTDKESAYVKEKMASINQEQAVCHECGTLLVNKKADELRMRYERDLEGLKEKNKTFVHGISNIDSNIESDIEKHSKIKKVVETLDSIKEVEEALSKEDSGGEETRNYIVGKIEEARKRKIEIETDIRSIEKHRNSFYWIKQTLASKRGTLVKHINKDVVNSVQDVINYLLSETDMNINVSIDKDLAIVAKFNKNKLSYKSLSTGQRRVVDILLMVALNIIYSEKNNLEHGLLGIAFFDEIISFLDDAYIDLVNSVFGKAISRKLVFITHNSRASTITDNKILVTLKNGISNYEFTWT